MKDGMKIDGPIKNLTVQEYACLKLKIPESDWPWLDKLIRKSLRDDFAAKAMQGMLSGAFNEFADIALRAYINADAMLKAREQ